MKNQLFHKILYFFFILASSFSDLSTNPATPIATPKTQSVSRLPDPFYVSNKQSYNLLNTSKRLSSRRKSIDLSELYKGPGGVDLPKDILQDVTIFSRKHKNAVIDVWWLYDDGGLTLLLPYIISTRRHWSSCKLRVFALANKKAELEFEQRSMASLLAKFRIDYSDLQLIPDITKKPQESTQAFFKDLIKNFYVDGTKGGSDVNNLVITEGDLLAVQDKTNRHLRLREYLLENSMKSDLVVMTLPMPRKSILSASLYMAWLECLSRDLPPFLFVRGNQSSVLTFYS